MCSSKGALQTTLVSFSCIASPAAALAEVCTCLFVCLVCFSSNSSWEWILRTGLQVEVVAAFHWPLAMKKLHCWVELLCSVMTLSCVLFCSNDRDDNCDNQRIKPRLNMIPQHHSVPDQSLKGFKFTQICSL